RTGWARRARRGGPRPPAARAGAGGASPAATAPPATVTDLKLYRSGGDFLEGRPPATELPAGGEVVACYAYAGAGSGTSLVLLVTGPNDAGTRVAQSEPYVPADASSVRCDPL